MAVNGKKEVGVTSDVDKTEAVAIITAHEKS